MSRKDFRLIADILKRNLIECRASDSLLTERQRVEIFISDFCNMFESNYPNWNKDKFLEYIGF